MASRWHSSLSVAVVVLVVLAGCASLPTGKDASKKATIDDVTFPDGTNQQEIANATELSETHGTSIRNRSYTFEITGRITHTNGTRIKESRKVLRRNPETGAGYEYINSSEPGDLTSYWNESARYQRFESDRVRYEVWNRTDGSPSGTSHKRPAISMAEMFLRSGTYDDPHVVERNDQTLIEYRLDNLSSGWGFVSPKEILNSSGTIQISQRGVVRHASVNFTTIREGEKVESQVNFHLTKIGDTTVQKPDWVSEAVTESQRTTRIDDSGGSDSARLHVFNKWGHVTENERIDYVNLTVMRGSDSGEIDLSETTIEWVGPETATTLTFGDDLSPNHFTVTTIQDADDSSPVINEQEDSYVISIAVSKVSTELQEGAEVKLKLITPSGGVTLVRVRIPESLDGESAVSV